MTNIWKKSLSLLLVVVMVFGILPVNALAADDGEQSVEETESVVTVADETSPTESTAETQVNEEAEQTQAAETAAAVETTESVEETEAPVEVQEAAEPEAPVEVQEAAASAEVQEAATPEITTQTVTVVPDVNGLPSDEELFAAYTERQFHGGDIAMYGTAAGDRLTGDEKLAYDALVPILKKIASGDRASAVITMGANLGAGYVPEVELAFTGSSVSEESLGSLLRALLADMPYDLYWFDKVTGISASYASSTSGKLFITLYFNVAGSYHNGETTRVGSTAYYCTADTAKTGAASNAARKAQDVVDQIAANPDVQTDYDKLVAYKEWICNAVSYNTAAANNGNFSETPDPWQVIYVFDDDSTTNVVCEGYSKAFQYMCDLSDFDGDVTCYSVTGLLGANGFHMWNIVDLDGAHYLVDVTNSDTGTIGAEGGLFLVGTAANANGSYTFKGVTFTYDDSTQSTWGFSGILTLEESDYEPSAEAGSGETPDGSKITEESFAAAMASAEDSFYSISNDLTITTSKIVIPSEVTVFVRAGCTLTIAEGGKLTVEGQLMTTNGSIVINGTLLNNNIFTLDYSGTSATLTVGKNGILQNNGYIRMGNGTVTVNGTYLETENASGLYVDSKVTVNGIAKNQIHLETVVVTEKALREALELQPEYASQGALINGDITVSSDLTIHENMYIQIGYMRPNGDEGILYGLTVSDGVALINNGMLCLTPFTGLYINNGASLINNGTLAQNNGEILVKQGGIFVDNGTLYGEVVYEPTIPVPAKPYKIANVVSGVHVYWTAIEGVQKYGLWRSETGKDGTYKWIANPMVPHFTDLNVESGKTYYYKVTAMDDNGKHSDKSEAIGIVYVSTPDITSRSNVAAGVKLGWEKITGATGYAIYRKSYEGTDDWVRVGTISGNSTFTWTDASVKNNNGEMYKYTIRALAGSDMKTLSGCRAAGRTMVRLSSQVLTGAAMASSTSIKCTWTTSSRVTGYEVRFMVGSTVYKTFTIGNYKTGVKTFTGLTSGQTYTIQVRTYKKVDGVGSFYSDWSTAKTVTLK